MRIEAFEDQGFFWLPEDEEAGHRVPGILHVSESGAITLDTFALMDLAPLSLAMRTLTDMGSMIPRILGVTREHGFVTLDNCVNLNSAIAMRATVFANGTYRATLLFIGVCYGPDEPAMFTRLRCNVEGLDQWLGLSGIRADSNPTRRGTTIEFDVPDDVILDIGNGVRGRIGFNYRVPITYSTTSDARVTQNAYIELEVDKQWEVGEVSQYTMWIRDFLCLATGEPVATTSLVVFSPELIETDDNGNTWETPITVVYESKGRSAEEVKVNSPMMTFNYSAIESSFPNLLKNWCDMYRRMSQPFRLFFDARYPRGPMSAEAHFLKVAEAIEATDKLLHGGKWTALAIRVRRLATPYAELLHFGEAIEEFSVLVASTRNYLVHHDDALRGKAADGAVLLSLALQCEALLICHFVGIATDSEAGAIELVRDKQPILKRLQR